MSSRLEQLEQVYEALKKGDPQAGNRRPPADLERRVRRIIDELDDEGRWVSTYAGERLPGQPKLEPGSKYISSEVFSRNIGVLCDYLKGSPAP